MSRQVLGKPVDRICLELMGFWSSLGWERRFGDLGCYSERVREEREGEGEEREGEG